MKAFHNVHDILPFQEFRSFSKGRSKASAGSTHGHCQNVHRSIRKNKLNDTKGMCTIVSSTKYYVIQR